MGKRTAKNKVFDDAHFAYTEVRHGFMCLGHSLDLKEKGLKVNGKPDIENHFHIGSWKTAIYGVAAATAILTYFRVRSGCGFAAALYLAIFQEPTKDR